MQCGEYVGGGFTAEMGWQLTGTGERRRWKMTLLEVRGLVVWGTIDTLVPQGLQAEASKVFCDSVREVDR